MHRVFRKFAAADDPHRYTDHAIRLQAVDHAQGRTVALCATRESGSQLGVVGNVARRHGGLLHGLYHLRQPFCLTSLPVDHTPPPATFGCRRNLEIIF